MPDGGIDIKKAQNAINLIQEGGGTMPMKAEDYAKDPQGGDKLYADIQRAKVDDTHKFVKNWTKDSYQVKQQAPNQPNAQSVFGKPKAPPPMASDVIQPPAYQQMNPSYQTKTISGKPIDPNLPFDQQLEQAHKEDSTLMNNSLINQTGLFVNSAQGAIPFKPETIQQDLKKKATDTFKGLLDGKQQAIIGKVNQYYEMDDPQKKMDLANEIKSQYPDFDPMDKNMWEKLNGKVNDMYYNYIAKKELNDKENTADWLGDLMQGQTRSGQFKDFQDMSKSYAEAALLGQRPKDVNFLNYLGEGFVKGLTAGIGGNNMAVDKNERLASLFNSLNISVSKEDMERMTPSTVDKVAQVAGNGIGMIAPILATEGATTALGTKIGLVGEGSISAKWMESANSVTRTAGKIIDKSITNYIPFAAYSWQSPIHGAITAVGMDVGGELAVKGLAKMGVAPKTSFGRVLLKGMAAGAGGTAGQVGADALQAGIKHIKNSEEFHKEYDNFNFSDYTTDLLAGLGMLTVMGMGHAAWDARKYDMAIDEAKAKGAPDVANDIKEKVDNFSQADQNKEETKKKIDNYKNNVLPTESKVPPDHLDHTVIDNNKEIKIYRPKADVKDIEGGLSNKKVNVHDVDKEDVQKIRDEVARRNGLKTSKVHLATIDVPTGDGRSRIVVYDQAHPELAMRVKDLEIKRLEGKDFTPDDAHELASLEGQDPQKFLENQSAKAKADKKFVLSDQYTQKADDLKVATDGNSAYNHIAELQKQKEQTGEHIGYGPEIEREALKYGFKIKRDGENIEVEDNKGRTVGKEQVYNPDNIKELQGLVNGKPTDENIKKAYDIGRKEGLTPAVKDEKLFMKDRNGNDVLSPDKGFKTVDDASFSINKDKIETIAKVINNGQIDLKFEGLNEDQINKGSEDIVHGRSSQEGEKLLTSINDMATKNQFPSEKYDVLDYDRLNAIASKKTPAPKPVQKKSSSIADLETNNIGKGEIKNIKPEEEPQKKSEATPAEELFNRLEKQGKEAFPRVERGSNVMSPKELEKAINDRKAGKVNEGVKALMSTLENTVKTGEIEIGKEGALGTGKKILPLDEYLKGLENPEEQEINQQHKDYEDYLNQLGEEGLEKELAGREDIEREAPEDEGPPVRNIQEPSKGGESQNIEEDKSIDLGNVTSMGLLPPEISKEISDAGTKIASKLAKDVKNGVAVLADFSKEAAKGFNALKEHKIDGAKYAQQMWKYGKALAKNTLIKDYFAKEMAGKLPEETGVLAEYQSIDDIRNVLNDAYADAAKGGMGAFKENMQNNIAHFSAAAFGTSDPLLKQSFQRTAKGLAYLDNVMASPDDIRNVLKLAFEQPKVTIHGRDLQPRTLSEWDALRELAKPKKPLTTEQYKYVKQFVSPNEDYIKHTALGKITSGTSNAIKWGLSRFTPAHQLHVWARPEMKQAVYNTVAETSHALTGKLQEKLADWRTKMGREALDKQWSKQEQDNVGKVLVQEHFKDKKYATPDELRQKLTPSEMGLYNHFKSGRDEMKQNFIDAAKKRMDYDSMDEDMKKHFDTKINSFLKSDNGYNPFFRSGDYYVLYHGVNDATGKKETMSSHFETPEQAEAFKKQISEQGYKGVNPIGEEDAESFPKVGKLKEFNNDQLSKASKGDMTLFDELLGKNGLMDQKTVSKQDLIAKADDLYKQLGDKKINIETYDLLKDQLSQQFDKAPDLDLNRLDPTSPAYDKVKKMYQYLLIDKFNPHLLEGARRVGAVDEKFANFDNAYKSLNSLGDQSVYGYGRADANSIYNKEVAPIRKSSNDRDKFIHKELSGWIDGVNQYSKNPAWLQNISSMMYASTLSMKPKFIAQVLSHKVLSTGIPEALMQGKGIEGKIKAAAQTGVLHPGTHTFMANKILGNEKVNPNDERQNYMNRLYKQGYIGDNMQRYNQTPDGNSKTQVLVNKAANTLNGWSSLHADMATRASSALVAYDIAKSKGITDPEELNRFGRNYVNKTNFVYNKTNMMPINNLNYLGPYGKNMTKIATQFLNTRINYAHYFYDDFKNWKSTMAKIIPAAAFAGPDAAGALGIGKLFTFSMAAIANGYANSGKQDKDKEKLILSKNPVSPEFLNPHAQFNKYVQEAVEKELGKGHAADVLAAFLTHGFMGAAFGKDASELTDIGQIAPSRLLNPFQQIFGLYGNMAQRDLDALGNIAEGDYPSPLTSGMEQIKKNLYYAKHGQTLSHGMENDMTQGEAWGNIVGLQQHGMSEYHDAEDMRTQVMKENKDARDAMDEKMKKAVDSKNLEAISDYYNNPTDENFDKAFPGMLNDLRQRDNAVRSTLPQLYQKSGLTTNDKANDIAQWRSTMVTLSNSDSMYVSPKELYTAQKWIKGYINGEGKTRISDKDMQDPVIAKFVDDIAGTRKNAEPAETKSANIK